MTVTYRKYGSTGIVAISGELDHSTAGALRDKLQLAADDPALRSLVLDLSSMSFMDSSGIGVLISKYKLFRRRSVTVSVRGLSGQAEKLFHISGLHHIFPKAD